MVTRKRRAPECSAEHCRRRTGHPTGRCFNHQKPHDPDPAHRPPAPIPASVVSPDEPTLDAPETDLDFAMKEWRVAGYLHRVGGPARVNYFEDGAPYTEIFCLDGVKSRLEGPAEIRYSPLGGTDPEWTGFYFEGDRYPSAREIATNLLLGDPERAELAVQRSTYAGLLAEPEDPRRVLEALAAGVTTHEGVSEVLTGSPVEWVLSYEDGRS